MSNSIAECILKTAPDKGFENQALITCKIEVPYYVWVELLTHKRFARNASSNRAMSVDKNLSSLGFYLPSTFFVQGVGMSSGDAVDPEKQKEALKIWNDVWNYCSKKSQKLSKLGVTKEQSSRVLPTFKMMRGLVTGTQDAWNKFFELRISPLADTAMQEFAQKVKTAIEEKEYQYSVLHLPYLTKEELDNDEFNAEEILYVGAGRIARLSYGDISTKNNDMILGQRLKKDNHLSPFEHSAGWVHNPWNSALCSKAEDMSENYGWESARATFERNGV
jgi:hypothetical protein